MQRQVFFLRSGEAEFEEILVERRGSRYRLVYEGRAEDLDAAKLPDGRLSILFADGRQLCGRGVARGAEGVDLIASGRVRRIPIGKRRQEHAGALGDASASGTEEVRALMHGRIAEVCVAPGDLVEAGTLLLVLEAMKMQNEIRASRPGVVERVGVTAGQTVEGGALMLTVTAGPNLVDQPRSREADS